MQRKDTTVLIDVKQAHVWHANHRQDQGGAAQPCRVGAPRQLRPGREQAGA